MLTLNRLFQVVKEVEIQGVKLSVRALGEAENADCHRIALLARIAKERALKDPNSDDYKLDLDPLNHASREELIGTVLTGNRQTIAEQCEKDIPYEYIPFPDNSTQQEQAEVIQKRQDTEAEAEKRREKLLEERMAALQKELDGLNNDSLLARAKVAWSELVAQGAYHAEFFLNKVQMSVEKDGKPYFRTAKEVGCLPVQIREKLGMEVREVNTVDPLSLSVPSAMG